MSDGDGYTYHIDEAVLVLPAGFEDRTTHALSWPGGEKNLGLVIMRRPAPQGLDAAVDADVKDMRAKLKGCVVEQDDPGELGAEPARLVALRYVRDGVVFIHRQIAACVDGKLLTMMVAGPAEHREGLETIFDAAVSSFRFRA